MLKSWRQNQRFDKERKADAQRKRNWNWTNLWKLQKNAEFELRLVADQTKCPGGVWCYTVHSVETVAGKDPEEILCTESYDDLRVDSNGQLIKPECFCCDFFNACTEDGILRKLEREAPDIYEAVAKLGLYHSRTYIMPALIRAKEVEAGQYTEFAPDRHELKAIKLAVTERDGTEKSPAMDAFDELFEKYPDVADINNGRWVTLQRKGEVFTISQVGPPTPIQNTAPEAMKLLGDKYPNVRSMGQNRQQGQNGKQFGGKNLRKGYAYQRNLVQNSWYGQEMSSSRRFFIDFAEFTTD